MIILFIISFQGLEKVNYFWLLEAFWLLDSSFFFLEVDYAIIDRKGANFVD